MKAGEKVDKDNMEDKENKRFVIVVGRQFGSGGHDMAVKLAERLGVQFYDNRLISEAAGKMGYSPEIFRRIDEKRPSFLRSLLSFTYGTQSAPPETAMSGEHLYGAQAAAIKEIAARESCVIVGRTADYVLRDHPGLLSIFVNAPMEFRIKNVMSRENCDAEAAESLIRKKDRDREAFYNYYTNRSWGHADNYHLCFDASRMDADRILPLIRQLLHLN